jgi:hypothetical protein
LGGSVESSALSDGSDWKEGSATATEGGSSVADGSAVADAGPQVGDGGGGDDGGGVGFVVMPPQADAADGGGMVRRFKRSKKRGEGVIRSFVDDGDAVTIDVT